MVSYQYSLLVDFIQNNQIKQPKFIDEVKQSAITKTILGVNVIGDTVTVFFDAALSSPTETNILDAIVAAHLGIYPNEITTETQVIANVEAENIDGIGGTGIDINGVRITPAGTVDGRDISVDGANLDSHIALTSGVHGVSGNVVGTSDAQTLTNKTINASSNTISNIANANISASAAIDATKIADGSISNSEFQNLNNLTSPAVGTTQTQTLTNKTLTTPIISQISNTGTLTLPTSTTTLVGRDTTDTLTNKTINALNNTITGLTKSDVGLSNVENLKVNLVATTAPTNTNDSSQGYSVGSRWFDITNDKEYVCVDSTVSAAIWLLTTFGSRVQTAVSEALSSTTSTTLQSKLVLTTSSLPLGIYRIGWYFEIGNTTQYVNCEYRVRLGATTIAFGRSPDLTGAADLTSESGFYYTPTAISGVQTIDIFYRALANTAQIRRARLEIFRV